MARLVLDSGPEKGKTIALLDEGTMVFGRDTTCGYQILDLSASRNHFEIVGKDGCWTLRDLDSRNGTVHNDDKIEYAELEHGDVIQVGEAAFRFDDEGASSRQAAAAHAAQAPREPVLIEDFKYKDPLVGKVVGGYELREQVGRGGMGTVYIANQLSLNRNVALKILSAKYTSDEKFVEMFVREARSAGGLNHPNIVQVYDVGRDGDQHFFSMEYMAKSSVGDLLKQLGKISVPRALAMIIHAAKGLEYAEKRGLIHCDIKPDNLMLNEEGTVKIVDLGLSRTTMGDKSSEETDVVFGTPNFVAPEQAQRKKIDHKVDQYSLGASFFNMVTGRPPFTGDSAREIVMKHIKEPAPLARDLDPAIPESVSNVIDRMLKKNPDDRFPSATALLDDLRAANIEINPQAAYTDGFPGMPFQEKPRPTGLIILGVGALVALLAGIFLLPMLFGGTDGAQDNPDNGESTLPDPDGNGNPPDLQPDPPDNGNPDNPSNPPDPNNPDPDSEKFDEQCQLAAELLKDVRELHKKNGDYDQIVIDNYRAIVKKFPKTPAAIEAEETADQLVAQLEKHRKQEEDAAVLLKSIERRARDFVVEGRFGEALATYSEFPAKEFEETEAAGEVIKGTQFIQERVKDAWTLGKTQAQSLERQGDYEGAKKFFLTVIDVWKIDRYSESARDELSRIDRTVASRHEAAAAAKEKAEKSALDRTEGEALLLAKTYDFRKAKEKIAALLAQPSPALTLQEFTDRAKTLIDDYHHMASLKAKMIEEAAGKSGKVKISLPETASGGGREAIVVGAGEDDVQIRLGGANTSFAWTSFSPKDFYEAAQRLLSPDISAMDHLRLGIFALVLGVPDKVEQQLQAAARDENPTTRDQADKALKRFKRGAGVAGQQIEARAEEEFGKIVDLFRKAEAEPSHEEAYKILRQALELFDAWREEYGHTQFVKARLGQ